MKIKKGALILSILIPLAVGGLSALISGSAMKAFETVNKPPLSPPMVVFPIAWTVLYILMGIASYLVYNSNASDNRSVSALFFYAAQLAVNFFWSIIFFNLKMYLFAFIWLLLLIVLTVITTVKFSKISTAAGWLMVPYLAWLLFAAYLTLGIVILN